MSSTERELLKEQSDADAALLDEHYTAEQAGDVDVVDDSQETVDAELDTAVKADLEDATAGDHSGEVDETDASGTDDDVNKTEDLAADAVDTQASDTTDDDSNDSDVGEFDGVPFARFNEVTRSKRKLERSLKGANKQLETQSQRVQELEHANLMMKQRLGSDFEGVASIDDLISNERIQEIRENYDDDIADMMLGMRQMVTGNQQNISHNKDAIESQGKDNASVGGDDADGDVNATAADTNDNAAVDMNPFEQMFEQADDASLIHRLPYWKDNNPEKYDKAIAVQEELKNDPNYSGMDMETFYSNVASKVETNRTLLDIEQANKAKDDALTDVNEDSNKPADGDLIPNNLSEVGGATGGNEDVLNNYESLDPQATAEAHKNMSREQKEQLEANLFG